MPHSGMSWARLKDHFSKFAVVYIVGFCVCAVLSNIVYSSTAPRVPSEKQVMIYTVDSYSNVDPLANLAAEALAYGQTVDETLEEVVFYPLTYNDPEVDYTSQYLLITRMAAGDCDIYLASELALPVLTASDACTPLDDYLANGWMEGLDLEPYAYTPVNDEGEPDGEPYIAALSLDNVDGLLELQSFSNEGAYLVIASNSANVETSMEVAEFMIRELMEGDYVEENKPVAATEEPADPEATDAAGSEPTAEPADAAGNEPTA